MTDVFHSPYPSLHVPDISLPDLILQRADAFGNKAALVDGVTGRRLTFSEFSSQVRSVARGLMELGFRKNDVIALMCPNRPEYAIVFLAAGLAGGINTTLNPSSTELEVRNQVRDCGAEFLFTVPELLDRVANATDWKAVLTPGPTPGTTSLDTLAAAGLPLDTPPIEPATDVVALPYSSGTTGMAKGVRLTHRNIVANLHQIAEPIFGEDDIILGLAPFFHIYGLTVVLHLGLFLGSTNIVLPRFDVQGFADTVETYGVTHANLVPPLILALAKHPSLDPARLSSLRTVQSGAAPLSGDTARLFSEKFDCRVLQGYGLTETSPVTHISPRSRFDIPVASIGPPVANTDCQLRDTETGAILGPNARGELYVRGPQVMPGYLDAPRKTAEMLSPEGWLRTGDVAWADGDGNFYIVDRVKELIKYKAYPVAPAELEAILVAHPAIEDAAVIPSPDPNAGEIPKAYVVARTEVDPSDLMSWVARRVAPHKKVRQIEFIDAIPKSPSGKILRRVLIERDRASKLPPGTDGTPA